MKKQPINVIWSLIAAAGAAHGQEIHITRQPADQRPPAGGGAAFSVDFTGPPETSVQWWMNGEPVPGETRSVFVLPHVLERSGFQSRVHAVISAQGKSPVVSETADLSQATANWSWGTSNTVHDAPSPGSGFFILSPPTYSHAINTKGAGASAVKVIAPPRNPDINGKGINEKGIKRSARLSPEVGSGLLNVGGVSASMQRTAATGIVSPDDFDLPSVVIGSPPAARTRRFSVGKPENLFSGGRSVNLPAPGVSSSMELTSWSWGASNFGPGYMRPPLPAVQVMLWGDNTCDSLDFALEVTPGAVPAGDLDGAFLEMEAAGHLDGRRDVSLGLLQVGTRGAADPPAAGRLRCDLSFPDEGATYTVRLFRGGQVAGIAGGAVAARGTACFFDTWPTRWSAPEIDGGDFLLGWAQPVAITLNGTVYQADCVIFDSTPPGVADTRSRVRQGVVFRGSNLESVILDEGWAGSAKNKVEHWGDPHENVDGRIYTTTPRPDLDGDGHTDPLLTGFSIPFRVVPPVGGNPFETFGVSVSPRFGAVGERIRLSVASVEFSSQTTLPPVMTATSSCLSRTRGEVLQSNLTVSLGAAGGLDVVADFAALGSPETKITLVASDGSVLYSGVAGAPACRISEQPAAWSTLAGGGETGFSLTLPDGTIASANGAPAIKTAEVRLSVRPPASLALEGAGALRLTGSAMDGFTVCDELYACRSFNANGQWFSGTGADACVLTGTGRSLPALTPECDLDGDGAMGLSFSLGPVTGTQLPVEARVPFQECFVSFSHLAAAPPSSTGAPAPRSMTLHSEAPFNGKPAASMGSVSLQEGPDATGQTVRTLSADFSAIGSPTHRLQLTRRGEVVLDLAGQMGSSAVMPGAGIVSAAVSSVSSLAGGAGGGAAAASYAFVFPAPGPVTAGGQTVVCDGLRILPELSATAPPLPATRTNFSVLLSGYPSAACSDVSFFSSATVSPRDATTGLPTGRRQHKPIAGPDSSPTLVSQPRLISLPGTPAGTPMPRLTDDDADGDGTMDTALDFHSPSGKGGVAIDVGESEGGVVSFRKGWDGTVKGGSIVSLSGTGHIGGSPEGTFSPAGTLVLAAASDAFITIRPVNDAPLCRVRRDAASGQATGRRQYHVLHGHVTVLKAAANPGGSGLYCAAWPDRIGTSGNGATSLAAFSHPVEIQIPGGDDGGGSTVVIGDQILITDEPAPGAPVMDCLTEMTLSWDGLSSLSIAGEWFMPVVPRHRQTQSTSFGERVTMNFQWTSPTGYLETSDDLIDWTPLPAGPEPRAATVPVVPGLKRFHRVADNGVAPR